MKIRKTLVLMLATSLVLSLTACGGKETEVEAPVKEEVTTETVEETTEAVESTEIESTESGEESTEAVESTEETEVNDTPTDTVASKLYELFETEIATTDDINEVANKLIEAEYFKEVSMTTMEVEPGWLNGFENEIKTFNNGVMFAPMIGTIPFVGYIFETDDTELLMSELEANALLNWNICTTADEMLVKAHDNYVFFVMSPYTFGE